MDQSANAARPRAAAARTGTRFDWAAFEVLSAKDISERTLTEPQRHNTYELAAELEVVEDEPADVAVEALELFEPVAELVADALLAVNVTPTASHDA